MTCLHCHARQACASRGLCNRCYSDKTIRPMYPKIDLKTRASHWDRGHKPTIEELDAMIRERYPTMPKSYGGEE